MDIPKLLSSMLHNEEHFKVWNEMYKHILNRMKDLQQILKEPVKPVVVETYFQIIESDIDHLKSTSTDLKEKTNYKQKITLLEKNLNVLQENYIASRSKVSKRDMVKIILDPGYLPLDKMHAMKNLISNEPLHLGSIPMTFTDGGLVNTLSIDVNELSERQRNALFSCLVCAVDRNLDLGIASIRSFIENYEMNMDIPLTYFEQYMILLMIDLLIYSRNKESAL
ncbi:hypothetical protein [Brevibacillus reuszeri]|uniref:hypothetical protein n=1 Tax=Brevibacillus reuszeri TaxID=54915 RepID=UPI003D2299C9